MPDSRHFSECLPKGYPREGTPVTPRPSASIALLRRGGKHNHRGLEVLMARRSDSTRFMPGHWIFPGGAVDPGDGDPTKAASLHACAIRELEEEVGIRLPAEHELVPFSRWITPEALPIRFDAQFYLALAPRHSPPNPDGREITEASWFSPRAVLAAHEAGQMTIAFPTVRQLSELSNFRSAEEALEAYRQRHSEAVLPVPVVHEDGIRLSLPGDPDYPAG